jgi:hypothetical protein
MGIFTRKTVITIEQLAEGVVLIPHMPNQMNKVALNHLIQVFETIDETKRIVLEVEYTAFCFSLWWFRYISYLQVKDASKIVAFNSMVLDFLAAYFKKIYPPDYIETISEIYTARVESYQNAYTTTNYFENISDLLLWHIDFSLMNGDPCIYPVKVPVSRPVIPNLKGKIACAAVVADLWKFIDKHTDGWKLV